MTDNVSRKIEKKGAPIPAMQKITKIVKTSGATIPPLQQVKPATQTGQGAKQKGTGGQKKK